MTDSELLRAFESCDLDPESVQHETHVRLAWAALRAYPPVEALERQTEGLKRYVERHGAEGKYHATITWAHLLLIQERIAEAPDVDDWADFAARNADLLTRENGGILARYYDRETLESELARRVFVLPKGKTEIDRASAQEE